MIKAMELFLFSHNQERWDIFIFFVLRIVDLSVGFVVGVSNCHPLYGIPVPWEEPFYSTHMRHSTTMSLYFTFLTNIHQA
jgi:hypothetical protein